MALKFKIWKEKKIGYTIKAQQFIDGNPDNPKPIPKLGETDPAKLVIFDHSGTGNEEVHIWVEDPNLHKSTLKLVYSKSTTPQEVNVTVGEK